MILRIFYFCNPPQTYNRVKSGDVLINFQLERLDSNSLGRQEV